MRASWKISDQDSAKGFQWFAMVRQGSSFLVAILLAKSTLSTYDIGIYESWMILGSLFSLLALTGIYQTFLNQYRKLDDKEKPASIFGFYLLSWSVTLIIAMLIYLCSRWPGSFLLGLNQYPGFIFVILFLLLHLNSGYTPYLFLAKEKKEFFLPYSIFYITGSVVSVIPALLGGDLDQLLISLLVWSVVEQILTLYLVLNYGSLQFQAKSFRLVIITVVPISIYMGSGLFAQFFDAWLVSWYYQSMDTLAIFRYGARELPGSLALASAFTSAMLIYPRENLPERIKIGSTRFMHLFFPIAILLLFFSKDLFVLVYNDDFKSGSEIFNTYLLLMISRWIFPQIFILSRQNTKDLIWISISELLVNMFFSLIFLYLWGLQGIVLGTVVAYFYEKIAMIILVRRKFSISFRDYIPVRWFLFYSSALIFAYFFVWTQA